MRQLLGVCLVIALGGVGVSGGGETQRDDGTGGPKTEAASSPESERLTEVAAQQLVQDYFDALGSGDASVCERMLVPQTEFQSKCRQLIEEASSSTYLARVTSVNQTTNNEAIVEGELTQDGNEAIVEGELTQDGNEDYFAVQLERRAGRWLVRGIP